MAAILWTFGAAMLVGWLVVVVVGHPIARTP
jgi:hypothetical protein